MKIRLTLTAASRAETAIGHSHEDLADAHRCLNGAETAAGHSHEDLAGGHCCLSCAETAVRHSPSRGWEHGFRPKGALVGGTGQDVAGGATVLT
jgi:hypothetical protein